MNENNWEKTGVFITGANGHLGIDAVKKLEAVGARIHCIVRSNKALAHILSCFPRLREIPHLIADIAEQEKILSFMKDQSQRYESIGFVNNAMTSYSQPLAKETQNSASKTLEFAFTYQMLLAKELGLIIQDLKKEGSIVNIGSMYGMLSPDPGLYRGLEEFHNPITYGAAKAALIQATRYLATHFGKQNIRYNSLSPGPFPSHGVQMNKEFIRRLSEKTALGRIGMNWEIGGPIAFLISKESSYVTGHNLVVDGGWTIM